MSSIKRKHALIIGGMLLLISIGSVYWGHMLNVQGHKQVEWLEKFGFPLKKVLLGALKSSEGTEKIGDLYLSILVKLPKEKATFYRDNFCADGGLECAKINLITASFFSFFDQPKFTDLSKQALKTASDTYHSLPGECGLDYELSRLNFELEQIRREKSAQKKEEKSKDLISNLSNHGGFEFSLNTSPCQSLLASDSVPFRLYLFLVAELFYFSGDDFQLGMDYLLSFEQIATFSKIKNKG